MKIYVFKGCQFSEDSIKNKSYSQLKEFGVSKIEFDKLVKEGAIIVPKIEKKKKAVKKIVLSKDTAEK